MEMDGVGVRLGVGVATPCDLALGGVFSTSINITNRLPNMLRRECFVIVLIDFAQGAFFLPYTCVSFMQVAAVLSKMLLAHGVTQKQP